MKKRERPKFKRAASRSSPEVSAVMRAWGKVARERLLLSSELVEQDDEGPEQPVTVGPREVESQGSGLTRVKPKAAVPVLADIPVDPDIPGTAPFTPTVAGENGNV